VKRSDYNVKATSAVHGTIRVRNKLKFMFEIVAHQYQASASKQLSQTACREDVSRR
jgi:hypothetical protein